MKRCFNWMLGFGLLLTACQTDLLPTDAVVTEGDGNVNFTVSALDGMNLTRSAEGKNSALGGLTNVDFTKYDLRYQLAVYRIEGGDYVEAITPQVKIVKDGYEPVTYSLRLTANRNYQVVVWADFVPEGTTADWFYDTSDFRDIKVPSTNKLSEYLNLESRDAYYVSKKVTVGDNGVSEALTLKRPFAKLRIVTTDWNYENLEMPDNFKVSYYGCKRFVNLDAVLGTSSSDDLGQAGTTAVYTATLNPEKDYAENYDASEHNRTILVDYLMTDVSAQTPIHLTLEALKGETTISKHNLTTDIPIQRNWLTTIIGNTLTTGAEFSVSIDEGFTNQWTDGECWWNPETLKPTQPKFDETTNTYSIYTRDEFAWLVNNEKTVEGKTILIMDDIDMSGVDWKPIYSEGEIGYVVDGQGHTLRNFTINGQGVNYKVSFLTFKAFVGVWGKFTGTMKNLTFENITINGLADSEVDEDQDHNKEYAYFAGCIGYAGSNYSSEGRFENVHAKHVHIKASGSLATQNIGGLVGWLGTGGDSDPNWTVYMKDCSAEDIHITGYQAGGLAGEVKADRGVGFVNCKTENVYIRIRLYTLDALRGTDEGVSAFIGNVVSGGNVTIRNCSPATNLILLKDSDGTPSDYEPASEYYGYSESGTPKIETTSGTNE